jgi:hypothetical protein
MKMNLSVGAAALLLAGRCTAQTYTFDTSIQGWRVFDIPYLGDHVPARTAANVFPAFDTAAGLPAPSLLLIDLVGETWLGAPASVAGNRSTLYGQSISFDIQYRTRDNAAYASIGIEGPGMTLYIAEGPPALSVWIHRSYALSPGLWRINSVNGALATAADIQGVLANLTGVYIHTEWTTGSDNTSVDNISIGTPAPACGTADFNCDGDLGTDADINAFFACLSGTCPLQPCPNSADFNGDGDVGTDADIESFFRVLSGGSC